MMRPFLASCLLACCAPAQELLWQVSSQQDSYGVVDSIGDLDGDGWADLLTPCLVNPYGYTTYFEGPTYFSMRILSGADGSILDNRTTLSPFSTAVVGDFDGDGYQDYAMGWNDGLNPTTYVEVWSPHLRQRLLLLTAPIGNEFARVLAGRVDLDGDGRQDLLVGSTRPFTGDTRGYSHTGVLLYTIPVGQGTVLDLLGLPDLDGDGCSEFVVGGVDYSLGFSRGYVALRSGRTGSLIRIAYDQQLGDFIGRPLCTAGDMDRDGVPDYATGNYWTRGARSLITVYSGATGTVIREWTATTYGFGRALVDRDADLDGVVDLIVNVPDVPNGPGSIGRVQVFSSRDQQVLMHTQPPPGVSYPHSYGNFLASLGIQPGSPYPAFALWDRSRQGNEFGRIEVWRCNPTGARITGTGCSSTGQHPTIGVRRVETPTGDQSRLVLGSAASNAFAWCLVAPAAASTFGGLNLPIHLGPLGFQGCNLYVPATTNVSRTTGSVGFDRGYAEVNLPLPLVPTGGFHAAAQWLVLDPATPGHAMTPRCEFRVQ